MTATSHRRALATSFLLTTLALATGCGGVRARTHLPSLELERLDGRPWNLRDEAGRVVVLQFFASFDNSSIGLSTALERLHVEYRDQGVSVVGVAMDPVHGARRRELVEAFCALNNLTFDVVLASEALGDGDTPLGRIPTIPATVIFDRAGDPVASATGPFRPEEVEELVDALVHGRPHPLLRDAR